MAQMLHGAIVCERSQRQVLRNVEYRLEAATHMTVLCDRGVKVESTCSIGYAWPQAETGQNWALEVLKWPQ